MHDGAQFVFHVTGIVVALANDGPKGAEHVAVFAILTKVLGEGKHWLRLHVRDRIGHPLSDLLPT